EPQKVFICYRREETAPYAGRIYDAMVARFGPGNVFMDLELAPGVDFVDRITKVVSGCVALIVVIGPRWAELVNEDGTRRIEDPDDFVRLEVETGLRRNDVTAIPLLVGGARMPRREDLPPELQAITRRNALELSDGRWTYDVGRLLSALDELLPDRPEPEEAAAPATAASPRWHLALEGAALAGVTAWAGRRLFEAIMTFEEAVDDEDTGEAAERIIDELVRRTGVLALVGAVLATWIALRIWKADPVGPLLKGLAVGALAGLAGGLLWALPVYVPTNDIFEFQEKTLFELVATAVAGGLLGRLIGSLWHPERRRVALVGGAIGGSLFVLVVLAVEWKMDATGEGALAGGLGAASIAGLALVSVLLWDRSESLEKITGAGRRRERER
ncbi:MAG TPA: TIR domain-containing protein, partial [Solirubrobacterales bacterium]|nr:TIR domain-containing protein [Solirubrobacterales bacterium]